MPKQYDAIVVTNTNGGLYVKGRMYSYEKKLLVANTFLRLFYLGFRAGKMPSVKEVAQESSVSPFFARKIINEIKTLGDVVDPKIVASYFQKKRGRGMKLNLEERKFLLQLRKERPERPNYSYTQHMNDRFGKKVCSKTITNFFKSKKEFVFEGSFCVPNKVPLDKYTNRNIIKIYEYQQTMTVLRSFVKKFNFLDKKHIINCNRIPRKVRIDPLIGKIPAIYVSGNFRDAHNIFACISASEHKKNTNCLPHRTQ